jgi:hypothetical protein
VTRAFDRRIPLGLLLAGAVASGVLAMFPRLAPPLVALGLALLFVDALVLCLEERPIGRRVGQLAAALLALLLMFVAIGRADPDTWQGTDRYPSAWLYVAIAGAAAYWITTHAALRRVGRSAHTGPIDHA